MNSSGLRPFSTQAEDRMYQVGGDQRVFPRSSLSRTRRRSCHAASSRAAWSASSGPAASRTAAAAYRAAALAWAGTWALAIAWPAARAAERAASSFSTWRAAAWAPSEAPRTSAIRNSPVRTHSRRDSIAWRGRGSPGYRPSKRGRTRSAQSAAHSPTVLLSVLLTRSSIWLSSRVTASLGRRIRSRRPDRSRSFTWPGHTSVPGGARSWSRC